MNYCYQYLDLKGLKWAQASLTEDFFCRESFPFNFPLSGELSKSESRLFASKYNLKHLCWVLQTYLNSLLTELSVEHLNLCYSKPHQNLYLFLELYSFSNYYGFGRGFMYNWTILFIQVSSKSYSSYVKLIGRAL